MELVMGELAVIWMCQRTQENLSPQKIPTNMYDSEPFCLLIKEKSDPRR